ncbi:MAG: TolC family protein, partial [Myxococcota bacterium]
RADYMPQHTLQLSYTRIGGFEDSSLPLGSESATIPIPRNRFRIRNQLDVPVSDLLLRVRANVQSAEAEASSAEAERQSVRDEVTLAVRSAYYDYVEARALAATSNASYERALHQAQTIEARHGAGLAPSNEVADARARVAEAEGEQVLAEGQVQRAAEALAEWRGGTAERWSVSLEAHDVDRLERYLAASEQRAELRAIDARLEALAADSRAARASGLPVIGVYGALEYSNPNPNVIPPVDEFQSSYELGAYLSFSLNGAVRARRQRSVVDARVEALEHERERLARAIARQVRQSHISVRTSEALVPSRQARLEAARESYEAAAAAYEAGTSTLTAVRIADEGLAAADSALWRARVDVLRNLARLERSAGVGTARLDP